MLIKCNLDKQLNRFRFVTIQVDRTVLAELEKAAQGRYEYGRQMNWHALKGLCL